MRWSGPPSCCTVKLPEGSEPSLCWGDARPGNIIWRDWQCVSVTDWEAASIEPPESDLARWRMFDRTMHDGSGVERLPGEPTREEQLAIYEESAGRKVDDLLLHEVFAAYRYCVVVQLANRFVDRGLLPPDNDFWVNNPFVGRNPRARRSPPHRRQVPAFATSKLIAVEG